jgi:hypothetical protein
MLRGCDKWRGGNVLFVASQRARCTIVVIPHDNLRHNVTRQNVTQFVTAVQ